MRVALYTSTRPGIQGLSNRLIRWWTRSPYSHCELIFSSGISASSSFIDGGVRFKHIVFNPAHWDFIDVAGDESSARQWFLDREDAKYDVLGIVGFVMGFIGHDKNKYTCGESIAGALGFADPERFAPALLAAVISRKTIF